LTPTVVTKDQQKLVDKLFDNQATYWRDTYREKDILGIIHQLRQSVALNYIDGLSFRGRIRVLEIGCGAGFMTVALAKRGFFVEAIDHSQAMIDLTLKRARATGNSGRIKVKLVDVHDLVYGDKSFDLVVGLGVVPWLQDLKKALGEINRVLKPKGYLVLTNDNAFRASKMLNPFKFPAIAQALRYLRQRLEKLGLLDSENYWINAPNYRQYSIREFNEYLRNSNLTILKGKSIGFGPFTFLGHHVFLNSIGVKIHQRLQQYSDDNYPILRLMGEQYIVLAQKKSDF
jgi:ubiquinone/menaquinone biosynthesis C-methylase UbiE